MWGILRPVKCTYDVRSPVEQSSSFKLFYHIIQSHSCFSQIAGRKAENWPLFTELPETKSSATQKKSFFDGDTLYVAMYSCCTILILGLVLLALLKTRDFAKQAKNPSPAHLSEKRRSSATMGASTVWITIFQALLQPMPQFYVKDLLKKND
uniref:Uncharacterized protein n=1 Tax=Sphaerodactylus townsendi TaxID=933632 RepID=A0ACB8GDF9_9SAUR